MLMRAVWVMLLKVPILRVAEQAKEMLDGVFIWRVEAELTRMLVDVLMGTVMQMLEDMVCIKNLIEEGMLMMVVAGGSTMRGLLGTMNL
jgi:hypothetical protein